MTVLSTQTHQKGKRVETLYRCEDCECCVAVKDQIELTRQKLREMEIELNTIRNDEEFETVGFDSVCEWWANGSKCVLEEGHEGAHCDE
jgi:ribosomal protein S14